MASEYLIRKAKREAKPPEPQREYTKKEKAMNWLYYNKMWLIVGAVLLWIGGSMLWNILGIGRTDPDIIIAYVGNRAISDEDAEKLERIFAALAEDLNGDGKVCVELRRYRLNHGGDLETAMYYNYAADTELVADITVGDSVFFLSEDPSGVQRSYQIFAFPDGTPPSDTDYTVEDKVFSWEACPSLASADIDPEICSGLFIGRRSFYDEKQASRHAGAEAIWENITQGAK